MRWISCRHRHVRPSFARRGGWRSQTAVGGFESGKARTSRGALPKRLRKGQVEFRVGDALDCRLPDHYFHVISAINLLDRVPHPAGCSNMPRLIPAGGQFILASPFTWLEEFTPRREWLKVEQVQAILTPRSASRDAATSLSSFANTGGSISWASRRCSRSCGGAARKDTNGAIAYGASRRVRKNRYGTAAV